MWRCLVFLLLLLALPIAQAKEQGTLNEVVRSTESLVQQLGWKNDDVVLSVTPRDIQLGEALLYEFDLDIGGKLLPVRLAEDIKRWEFLSNDVDDSEAVSALEPFQLRGPVELWIQDGKELRLAVPHDVDAGLINRILLADGANVTILGAREISLARPLRLPLPIAAGDDSRNVAASLVSLTSRLKEASRSTEKPLLSLRIVGPTSMVSKQQLDAPRLKVRRLSPGAVELATRETPSVQAVLDVEEDNDDGGWLWPLVSVHGSNQKLQALEQVLRHSLDEETHRQEGFFSLLRAKASAARFVKVEFTLEKKMSNETLSSWPQWATKPEVQRHRFELLAKLEGSKLSPLSVKYVDSVVPTPPIFPEDERSNASYSKMTSFMLPPTSPMTFKVFG